MSTRYNRALCNPPDVILLQDEGKPRFAVADLASQLEPLLSGLFGAFQKPESSENEYVMKCVMRVIAFVGKDVRSLFPPPPPPKFICVLDPEYNHESDQPAVEDAMFLKGD